MRTKRQSMQTVSTGSMADIAFLLLIFFLVSTTILQDKGLMLQLPPKSEEQSIAKIHERDLFKIQINSKNEFLIQGQVRPGLYGLREDVKLFVSNSGVHPHMSVSPEKAVISIKTNRGTDYGKFVDVLDEVRKPTMSCTRSVSASPQHSIGSSI